VSTRHFDHSSGAGRDPAPLWLAATPLAFFLPANASQSVAARFPVIESLDPAGRQGMRPGHLQRAPSHSLLMGGGMALDKPGRTHSPAWLTFPLSLNRVSDSERLTGRRKCTSVMRATAPRLVQHGDSRRDGTHLTSPARWMGFCRASDTRQREPGMSSRYGGWKPGARDSRRDGTHSMPEQARRMPPNSSHAQRMASTASGSHQQRGGVVAARHVHDLQVRFDSGVRDHSGRA
jgi:hypothetical protein